MIKKGYKMFSVFLVLLLLTGCWDYMDIENRNVILSMGVDYKNEQVNFIASGANFRGQKGGTDKAASPSETVFFSSYGKDFDEAREELQKTSPFPVFQGAVQVVVFGRDIAGKGIEPYMHRISRIFDYRKSTLVVLSRDPVEEIMKIKPKNDMSFGFMVNDIIQQNTKTGNALFITAGDILSAISFRSSGYVIPYIEKEIDSVKYMGFAAMDQNSKLLGFLDRDESRGVVYLLSPHPSIIQVLPHPKNSKNLLSFMLDLNKRKINTEYKNGKVAINIKMNIDASLVYAFYIDQITEETKKELEDSISQKVKKEVESLIKKSQEEFKCDIFEFAKYFRADNPKIYKNINWGEVYKDASVNLEVNTNIIRYGLQDYNVKKEK